jgi:hypothetical protein
MPQVHSHPTPVDLLPYYMHLNEYVCDIVAMYNYLADIVPQQNSFFHKIVSLNICDNQKRIEIDINPVSLIGSWFGHVTVIDQNHENEIEISFESPQQLSNIIANQIGDNVKHVPELPPYPAYLPPLTKNCVVAGLRSVL